MDVFFVAIGRFKKHVKSHLIALYDQSDPLNRGKLNNKSQTLSSTTTELSNRSLKWPINGQFILPLLMLIYTSVYGTVGFHFEVTGNVNPWDNFSSNAHIFTHQIAPRSIWPLIDMAMLLDVATAVKVYVALLLSQKISTKSQFLTDGSSVWFGEQIYGREEAAKLLSHQRKIKFTLLALVATLYTIFTLYFMFCVFFVNQVYSLSLWTAIYWALFPLFMVYLLYGLFGAVIYVVLASKYIRIRQQTLLAKLQQLTCKLEDFKTDRIRIVTNFTRRTVPIWRQYLQLNGDLILTCKTISEYSRACGPLLSAVIPFYISIQCYLLYIVLFVDSIPLQIKQLFIFDVVEINLFLYVLTDQCAGIVRLNQKLEIEQRKFFLAFFKHEQTVLKGVHIGCLLKAETLLKSRRLYSYSFRAFGYYRITPKSYSLIVSYISTFFMFVSKRDE